MPNGRRGEGGPRAGADARGAVTRPAPTRRAEAGPSPSGGRRGGEPVAPAPSAEIGIAPDPPSALIVVADTVVGGGPTRVRRPAAGGELEVEVRLRGYETERVVLTAESPADVAVKLTRKPRRSVPGPVVRP